MAYWKYIKLSAIPKALTSIPLIIFNFFTLDIFRIMSGLVFIASIFGALMTVKKNKTFSKNEMQFFVLAAALLIFSIFLTSEFIVSIRWFRYRWAFVPVFMLMFLIIDKGSAKFKMYVKIICLAVIIVTILTSAASLLRMVNKSKSSEKLLDVGGNTIYLMPYQYEWKDTVTKTINYINNNVPSDEHLLAAPYDPIYYFLSKRKIPTREMSLRIEDVATLINKDQNITFLLISNRYKYFAKNIPLEALGFEHIATFGDMNKEGG